MRKVATDCVEIPRLRRSASAEAFAAAFARRVRGSGAIVCRQSLSRLWVVVIRRHSERVRGSATALELIAAAVELRVGDPRRRSKADVQTYLGAQYRRLRGRRGHKKALGAVRHSIIIAAWHMLTTGELYNDPGADYLDRRVDPQRLIAQLEGLGQTVLVEPAAA